MPDLLWDYPVPAKSCLLSVLLDSTFDFSRSLATGVQDLLLNDQGNPSVSHDIGKSFI